MDIPASQQTVTVEKPKLINYVNTLRGNGDWPNADSPIVLVLYDILMMTNGSSGDILDILGIDGITQLQALVDDANAEPPWDVDDESIKYNRNSNGA